MFPTERNAFYEQSAALVYFLMYRCGPDTRDRLRAYPRSIYTGEHMTSVWTRFGFDDFAALEEAFREFLERS